MKCQIFRDGIGGGFTSTSNIKYQLKKLYGFSDEEVDAAFSEEEHGKKINLERSGLQIEFMADDAADDANIQRVVRLDREMAEKARPISETDEIGHGFGDD